MPHTGQPTSVAPRPHLPQKPKEGWEAVADNSTRFFTSGTLLGL